jgi:hypothetical protein
MYRQGMNGVADVLLDGNPAVKASRYYKEASLAGLAGYTLYN